MATAHLLHGFLGSGKTTLACRLAEDHDAVRFTPDEWMARLLGKDPPASIFQEKATAIMALMEPIWTQCLRLGVDVVLDFGFWSRADRDRVRHLIEECGGRALLYRLDCPDDEARQRIAVRNELSTSLFIAPTTFDVLKASFEPLAADEGALIVQPTPAS